MLSVWAWAGCGNSAVRLAAAPLTFTSVAFRSVVTNEALADAEAVADAPPFESVLLEQAPKAKTSTGTMAREAVRRRGEVTRPTLGLHARNELLDPLIDGSERILAQHRPSRLIVELEVNPVDGEVTFAFLCPLDELAPQSRAGGLRGP